MKRATLIVALFVFLVALPGCEFVYSVLPFGQYLRSAVRIGDALFTAMEDLTPSQEYYLGRSLSANVMERYNWQQRVQTEQYLNLVGGAVAAVSERPVLFGGSYHFLIIDSDEVNALSCPNGFVFLTKGMLRLAADEDELAAICAHEVAHIVNKDGLEMVQQSRETNVISVAAQEGLRHGTAGLGSEVIAELTGVFSGYIDDSLRVLIDNGYARDDEREADQAAMRYLARIGYDPRALVSVLRKLEQHGADEGGIFQTHPSAEDRISDLTEVAMPAPNPVNRARRAQRFNQQMGWLR